MPDLSQKLYELSFVVVPLVGFVTLFLFLQRNRKPNNDE